MARTTRIQVETEVATDPIQTYRMFTNSTLLREWLADEALASPVEEGRLYLSWSDGYQTAGRFTELEPGRSIGFIWNGTDEKGPTKVKVTLKPIAAGTLVRVRHSGFDDNKTGRRSAAALEAAWESSLENLASVTKDGSDLRITRRPMLGVYVEDEVTADRAAAFG
ncbi:MAG: SRPBCC family protein, partial [Acidimicrobiia bacterium]